MGIVVSLPIFSITRLALTATGAILLSIKSKIKITLLTISFENVENEILLLIEKKLHTNLKHNFKF